MKGGGLHVLFPLFESKDVKVQGGAAAMIANLASKRKEYPVLIVNEGGLDGLVPLAGSKVSQVQLYAIGAIGNMIRDPQTAMSVAQHDNLLATLGKALVNGDEQVQTVAGNCLANFASHAEIRPALREERVHLALITTAEKIKEPAKLQPVGRAFACMCLEAESQVLIVQSGGLQTVLKLLRLPDQQLQEFAMMALINIAANAENADAVLAEPQTMAALNHIARTRTDQFQKMAQGVIQKLAVQANTVIGEDVE